MRRCGILHTLHTRRYNCDHQWALSCSSMCSLLTCLRCAAFRDSHYTTHARSSHFMLYCSLMLLYPMTLITFIFHSRCRWGTLKDLSRWRTEMTTKKRTDTPISCHVRLSAHSRKHSNQSLTFYCNSSKVTIGDIWLALVVALILSTLLGYHLKSIFFFLMKYVVFDGWNNTEIAGQRGRVVTPK